MKDFFFFFLVLTDLRIGEIFGSRGDDCEVFILVRGYGEQSVCYLPTALLNLLPGKRSSVRLSETNLDKFCPRLSHHFPERRQTSLNAITKVINPYTTAFPYGNGMVLHFYQQQESSTTKTVHKVINKGLKTYV